MNVFEDCIIVLIRAALALFDFYLKQKKGFRFEFLVKIPTPSPSTEEFGLDIQK